MARRSIVTLATLLSFLACTTPRNLPNPDKNNGIDSSARDHPDHFEGELPLLSGSRARPLLDLPAFVDEMGGYFYRWPDETEIPRTPAFETEAAAVSATLEWLRIHFEPLGEGVSLRGSASRSGDMREIQVDVEECFRGLSTSRSAYIEYNGQTMIRVYVGLCKLEPIPDTAKRVISREEALKIRYGSAGGSASVRGRDI